MKINKKKYKERWVKVVDDVEVLLRPFPMSQAVFAPGSDESFAKAVKNKFMYCVVDWKGIVDEDDKPVPCDDENKEFVFDFISELRDAIADKLSTIDKLDQVNESEKKI